MTFVDDTSFELASYQLEDKIEAYLGYYGYRELGFDSEEGA